MLSRSVPIKHFNSGSKALPSSFKPAQGPQSSSVEPRVTRHPSSRAAKAQPSLSISPAPSSVGGARSGLPGCRCGQPASHWPRRSAGGGVRDHLSDTGSGARRRRRWARASVSLSLCTPTQLLRTPTGTPCGEDAPQPFAMALSDADVQKQVRGLGRA